MMPLPDVWRRRSRPYGASGANASQDSSRPCTLDARGLRNLPPGPLQVAERLGDHEPGVVGQHRAAWGCPGTGGAASTRRCCGTATATCPRWSSGTPTWSRPSVVATVIWTGSSIPCRRAVSSTSPTARATAAGGSSSRPKVSARKNSISESVEPSISANRPGSTAIARSRFMVAEPDEQAVVHPQPVPVAERVAVGLLDRRPGRRADVGEDPPRAPRAPTAHAGCGRSRPARCCGTRPGVSGAPYQPTPNPSPFVVVAPELGVLALHDQRVLRLEQQVLQAHRRAGVRQPSAHVTSPCPEHSLAPVTLLIAATPAVRRIIPGG